MATPCVTCAHPNREQIDADLVAGRRSMRSLAVEHGMDRHSLARHRDHIGPELVQVMQERASAGPATALDEYRQLLALVKKAVYSSDRLQPAMLRELRGCLDSIAKITGELDDTSKVAVINYADPMWSGLERTLTAVARDLCPDCRTKVGSALQSLPIGGAA